MTLKISIHNAANHNSHNIPIRKLMREDLRRRTWMITLSCLVNFMASLVAFMFMISTTATPLAQIRMEAAVDQGPDVVAGMTASNFMYYFSTIHLNLQMLILAVAALITAVCGFQYLYSRRMTDFYHSTPASRQRLFAALWINGFLIWFLPALLGQVSVGVLALYYIGRPAFWGGVTLLLAKELGLFVLCFLILYNACLVSVMISGNAKNAVVNLFVYGFGFLAIYITGSAYMSCYLDTFYLPDKWLNSPPVFALSPLATPIFLCISFFARTSETLPAEDVATAASQWPSLLILSAAVMAINFGLSLTLHKRRPSELAERGVENKFFRIPLNFVTSTFCGLWLSLLFVLISGHRSLGWALFGIVFGCVLAFACMNILHHTSFKALFSHKLQLAVTLIFTCTVLFVFHYDVLGYDTYLPEKDSVTELSFYNNFFCGEGFGLQENADGFYSKYDYTEIPESMIFTDPEQNYHLLETLVDTNNYHPEDAGRSYLLEMKIKTSHGSYHRNYTVRTEGSSMEALQPFLETDAFLEYFHPAACGVMKPPAHIDIKTVGNETISLTDSERIELLCQAYEEDFRTHFRPDVAITYSNTNRLFSMNYAYPRKSTDASNSYYHLGMDTPVWYEHTLSLLQEWYPGYTWSQEDMDITAISVDIKDRTGTLPSLQKLLGTATIETTDQISGKPESAVIDKTQENGSWTRLINDPEEIAALKPYLYIGHYNSSEFISIGKAEILLHEYSSKDSEQDSKHRLSINCYMRRGEIPEGFAESLTFDSH